MINNSDYSVAPSIDSYFTRELLVKKIYCEIFLSGPPNSRALKLIYSKVERGYSLMTYPGLIPKLELKSPTTVVLLDLSYFSCIVINLQWCLLNWNLRDCTLEVSM